MRTVLLTAYEPYDHWSMNASQLVLAELMRDLPQSPQVTTKLLPVNFDAVKAILAEELAANYDYALHLGQAPGWPAIHLEAVGLNIARDRGSSCDRPLCEDGPVAYRSTLPLFEWRDRIAASGIPVEVSFHAGTYLCNAALYLTHYFSERLGLKTQAAFFHLPIDPRQLGEADPNTASLPSDQSASALRIVLDALR
jgi:pyroglutamyl-peptidase